MNTNEDPPKNAEFAEDSPVFSVAGERRLIRPSGSRRHVVFSIKAPSAPRSREREPLSLSLVIDRSGSMSGDKMEMAKLAALKVIEKLDESDRVSVVIFDSEVDVLLPLAPVTGQLKIEACSRLAGVQARGSTALHEGWLTGCRSIASNNSGSLSGHIARCFLLTDGNANDGLTDPEKIASQAADVRKNAGISTSTFGIGDDYNEGLLGPMAIAGSGQFHHLRDPREIKTAFGGELSELFSVVTKNLRVEIDISSIMHAEIVSQYWVHSAEGKPSLIIDVGDLISDEERNLVLNLHFPKVTEGTKITVRARLVWESDGSESTSGWQAMDFEGASERACDKEPRDMRVMHWVGLHHSEKAKKEALDLLREGNQSGALNRLEGVIRRISEYKKDDPDLKKAAADLESLRKDSEHGNLRVEEVREIYYHSQRMSRGQRDHRGM